MRKAEAACSDEILRLFGFDQSDLQLQQLIVAGNRWRNDLFDPNNLTQFGIKAGSAAMKGAAAGAGLDLLTGGLSLGLATVLGATAGVLWSGGRRFGRDIAIRLRGHQQLCIDEPTLKVLWFRLGELLQAVLGRGHAAEQPLQLSEGGATLPVNWSQWLSRCRSNEGWSTLSTHFSSTSSERDKLIGEIGKTME